MRDISELTTTGAWSLVDEGEGIVRLVFDLPDEKVNKLTSAVLEDLERVLEAISTYAEVKALIVASGKEDSGTFIAGADIGEIRAIASATEATEKARRGQQVLDRLRTMPQVTVAAIHGACLGGGTELALACDCRIASLDPRTRIGLPEVQLGLLPGFGGTQRLPRLIGIQRALPLILGGKKVDARRAGKLGLVDRAVYPGLLLDEARALANHVLDRGGKRCRPRRPRRPWHQRLLEAFPPGRTLIGKLAEKGIRRSVGDHYPAPLEALRVVLEGYGDSLPAGLELEAAAVGKLIASDICKNIIDVYLSSEAVRRGTSGDRPSGAPPRPRPAGPRHVGVLGAGVMGGGITALLLRKGFRVRMKDVQAAAIQLGLRKVDESLGALVKRRRMTKAERQNLMGAVTTTLDDSGFGSCESVIEAVVEKMSVKQDVFRALEAGVRDDTLLCSNTSALSITEMQSVLERPERLVGLHFFNPVHRMPLVEVIPGERTSDDAVRRAEDLARALGKFPVQVADRPGFLVNRILGAYLGEAAHLFDEGFEPEAVDRVLRKFGMPMGPFQLIDEVGLDVAHKVSLTLHQAFGERLAPSPVLARLLEEGGLLGKKDRRGFYLHGKKGRKPNPAALKFGGTGGHDFKPDDPDLWVKRLTYTVINEAASALGEGVVASAELLDLAMVMGTGFAPFRGGPLRYADAVGVKTVADALAGFGPDRLKPCEHLRRLADDSSGFYQSQPTGVVNAE